MCQARQLAVAMAAKSSAARTRLYRKRQRLGVVCVVPVPIYSGDVAELIEHHRIDRDDEDDREKIAEAIEGVVDDFTEGKLVLSGDGSRVEDGGAKPDKADT